MTEAAGDAFVNYLLEEKDKEEKLKRLRKEIEYSDKAKPEGRSPIEPWVSGYEKSGG